MNEQETATTYPAMPSPVIVRSGHRAEALPCGHPWDGYSPRPDDLPLVVRLSFNEGKLAKYYGAPAVPTPIDGTYVLAEAYAQRARQHEDCDYALNLTLEKVEAVEQERDHAQQYAERQRNEKERTRDEWGADRSRHEAEIHEAANAKLELLQQIGDLSQNLQAITEEVAGLQAANADLLRKLEDRKTVKEFTSELSAHANATLSKHTDWVALTNLLNDFDGTTAEIQQANEEEIPS
ncbi:MAG: hypothetical protein WCZ86_06190 [Desulfurivibrionaceae bacterium]